MKDSDWPRRFKVGLVVGLMLCGTKIWFTVIGVYGVFRAIEQTSGQATPDELAGSVSIAKLGNIAFMAGVAVLLVTVAAALSYRSGLKREQGTP